MPEVTTSEIDAKELPGSLAKVATRLADAFGLPTSSLIPVCLALGGAAAGNSAKAKIPNWPGLLNSALHIALCDDTAGRLSQAVDLLLQPFREFRDAGLLRLRDGNQSLQEQRCLGPIVAEDPLPGQLATLLTVSTDASVLIVYHEEGLRRLLDAVSTSQSPSASEADSVAMCPTLSIHKKAR